MNRLIISTDMDGTLLGHDAYDCDVAKPLIAKLILADIPVILNTSKTAAEVRLWQSQLNLDLPAIVENGSALIEGNRYTHIYGAPMGDLEAFLLTNPPDAINFVTCDPKIANRLTGLSGASLEAARSRAFSIPLKFPDMTQAKAYQRRAQAQGLQCVQGGRFMSLQGQCDKGTTLKHLVDQYRQQWDSDITLVALGDNQNDLGMLEISDIPIVVKTASGHGIKIDRAESIYTTEVAPNGWVEGVTQALDALSIKI
jgi:mannosyl-3-phosphoglycerate phosphatase